MENKDAAFGLRPAKHVSGSPFNGGQSRYRITTSATSYSTNIYMGDIVTQNTGGTVTRIARADGGSATSDIIIGVFNGCFYTDPTTQKPTFSNFYPGSIVASDITAFVVDDPDAVFLMDADATFARADIFRNYSVTNTTGSTKTGISEVQLDVSVSGTNASFVIQAIDISQDPNNSDVGNANANILVRINKHFYRDGTGI